MARVVFTVLVLTVLAHAAAGGDSERPAGPVPSDSGALELRLVGSSPQQSPEEDYQQAAEVGNGVIDFCHNILPPGVGRAFSGEAKVTMQGRADKTVVLDRTQAKCFRLPGGGYDFGEMLNFEMSGERWEVTFDGTIEVTLEGDGDFHMHEKVRFSLRDWVDKIDASNDIAKHHGGQVNEVSSGYFTATTASSVAIVIRVDYLADQDDREVPAGIFLGELRVFFLDPHKPLGPKATRSAAERATADEFAARSAKDDAVTARAVAKKEAGDAARAAAVVALHAAVMSAGKPPARPTVEIAGPKGQGVGAVVVEDGGRDGARPVPSRPSSVVTTGPAPHRTGKEPQPRVGAVAPGAAATGDTMGDVTMPDSTIVSSNFRSSGTAPREDCVAANSGGCTQKATE